MRKAIILLCTFYLAFNFVSLFGSTQKQKWHYLSDINFTTEAFPTSLCVYKNTPYVLCNALFKYDGTSWIKVIDYFSTDSHMFSDDDYIYILHWSEDDIGGITLEKFDGSVRTTVGDKVFAHASGDSGSLFVYKGIPYVAFINVNKQVTVMYYSDESWHSLDQLTMPKEESWGIDLSLFVDNIQNHANNITTTTIASAIPYLAFEINSNQFTEKEKEFGYVMKWDKNEWTNMGCFSSTSLPDYDAEIPRSFSLLLNNGIPYVAFGKKKAEVMLYNGKKWISVGKPEISDNFAEETKLCIDNGVIYLAYLEVRNKEDFNNRRIVVKKYIKNQWIQIENFGLPQEKCDGLSFMVYNGTPYVGFVEGDKEKLAVMAYDDKNDSNSQAQNNIVDKPKDSPSMLKNLVNSQLDENNCRIVGSVDAGIWAVAFINGEVVPLYATTINVYKKASELLDQYKENPISTILDLSKNYSISENKARSLIQLCEAVCKNDQMGVAVGGVFVATTKEDIDYVENLMHKRQNISEK